MFGISIVLSEFTANTMVPCKVMQGNGVLCWLSAGVISSSGGSHGLPEFVQSGNENSFPFRHVHASYLGRKGKIRVKPYLLHTQNWPLCELLRIALILVTSDVRAGFLASFAGRRTFVFGGCFRCSRVLLISCLYVSFSFSSVFSSLHLCV